jgi:hypothetical protein
MSVTSVTEESIPVVRHIVLSAVSQISHNQLQPALLQNKTHPSLLNVQTKLLMVENSEAYQPSKLLTKGQSKAFSKKTV